MDPITISIASLGLVENIDKLLGTYRSSDERIKKHLYDVFGELSILQSVLVESKSMMDELLSLPPSLITALQQCQEMEKHLAKILNRIRVDGGDRRVNDLRISAGLRAYESELRQIATAFKSAILLLRDIATDSLTHHLLRAACGGDRNTNVSGDLYIIDNTVKGAARVPDTTDNTGIDPGVQKQRQYQVSNKPPEDPTLFDATISFIADADISRLPEAVQGNNFGSPCACGLHRMGVWFPVRGKFDSGANTDFVSEDVIERAGLGPFVIKTSQVASLKIFGVTFDFNQTINLNWQLNNHTTSYTRKFWVAPEVDNFDLIIGAPWLLEHGYETIQTHQSRKATSFFGLFNLRMPRTSKAQAKAEKQKAVEKTDEAKRQMKLARLAALTPRSTQAGSPSPTGSTSTNRNARIISSSAVSTPAGANSVNSGQNTPNTT